MNNFCFGESMTMTTAELCFTLSAANGTAGDEPAFFAESGALLASYADFKENTLHSLVATVGDGDFEILLDAHIDRVGLLVRGIDDDGFLLVDRVGGIDSRVLVGSEVIVCGKEKLPGVICSTPPHLQKGDDKKETVEFKNLAVDIGLNKETAETKVQIGDRVVFYPNQAQLLGTRIVSSAFDDRAGVAALLLAAEKVKGKLHHCRVRLQLASQEESGGAGAKTSAFEASPAVAIAVDVGFGSGPYCDKHETIDLGKGTSIGISPALDRALTQELVALAKEQNIPFQHDVMPGRTGTNADHIQLSRGGVKCALLSIPLRSMHTGVEVIDTRDVEATAELLAAYILKKEAELAC